MPRANVTNRVAVSNRKPVSGRMVIPQIQNLFTFSEQANNAVWFKSLTTVNANTVANPLDGAITADTIIASAGAGFHQWGYSIMSIAPVNVGPFTFSFYVQRNNNDWIAILIPNNVLGNNTVYFNTATGLFGSTGAGAAASGVTARIVQTLSNNWYRISATVPSMPANTVSATAVFGIFMANADGGANFTATGTESVNIFGMQLVQANWEGPYTQTVASNVNTGNLRNIIS